MNRLKLLARLGAGILPPSKFKNRLLTIVGYHVAATATVGPVLFWRVDSIRLAPGSSIRAFNVFRDLDALRLGFRARIGSWNWVAAARPFLGRGDDAGSLVMSEESAMTSRHYVDCSGGVEVGAFSIVAGHRSTILSHSIDFRRNEQRSARVSVGHHSFVGTNCVLLMGASVPDRSVLSAGSVLGRTDGPAESGLWVGNPARWSKPLVGEYFSRTTGYVTTDAGPRKVVSAAPADEGGV